MPVELQPLAVAGVISLSSLLYLLSKRFFDNSDIRKVQRVPGGHWLWGHEQEAWTRPAGDFYSEHFEKMGLVYTMKGALFHPDILVVSDPAAISHIFTKHVYNYTKSPIIRPLVERLLGKGVVWAEGEEHKAQRQMLTPAFSVEMVKGMEDDMRRAADKLVASLQTHISSSSDPKINLVEWTSRATLDIIGSVGFGHDFQCGESTEAKQIFASFKQIVEMGLDTPGFIAPVVVRAMPFITQLPVEAIQAQGEIKIICKSIARKLVEERNAMGASAKEGRDLLSVLLRSNDKDGDIDQLLDNIATFVLVGHETVSAALNYTLHELSKRQDIQERLRQEIMEFVGSGAGGEPTYEEYQSKLPYLDAVCKEILRVFPPVPYTERVAVKDDVLPLRYPITTASGEEINSIKISEGQIISVSSMAINHSKAAWGPDADEFRPERWMSTNKVAASGLTQGWSGMFTFLEGPRICIGYRMALFEYKILLSTLIKSFEFGDAGKTVISRFSSTLQPQVIGEEKMGIQLPVEVKLVL